MQRRLNCARRRTYTEVLESRVLFSTVQTLATVDPTCRSIVEDSAGNIYGTDEGTSDNAGEAGRIFEIPVGSNEPRTLYSFGTSAATGYGPIGDLLLDSKGDLFGINASGGGASVEGTLWELPAGTNTLDVLAQFDVSTGSYPFAVASDARGDLFCVTGQVPDIMPSSTVENGLFEYPADGSGLNLIGEMPDIASITADANGDLFGVAGTASNSGNTIFEVPAGSAVIQTLAVLTDPVYGAIQGIAVDSNQNIFLTSENGGSFNAGGIFELSAGQNTPTLLASLTASTGVGITTNPVLDASGDIFVNNSITSPATPGSTILELHAGSNTFQTLTPGNANTGLRSLNLDSAGNLLAVADMNAYSSQVTATVIQLTPPATSSPSATPVVFGTVDNRPNVSASIPVVGGGNEIFRLDGPGTGTITNDQAGGYDLSLSNTTVATRVLVGRVGEKTGRIEIADMYDYGSLGQFIAPDVNIFGAFSVSGSLKKLSLGDINASTMNITGSRMIVRFGAIASSNINFSGDALLSVGSTTNSDFSATTFERFTGDGDFWGQIYADNIGSVLIKGNLHDSGVAAYSTYYPSVGDTSYILHSIRVLGSVSNTQVAVGESLSTFPSYPIGYLPGGRIDSIFVRKTVAAGSHFAAATLPAFARIDGVLTKTAGNSDFMT